MAFEFTFTPRFQKSFKKLTDQEKKQLKKKLLLLAENPSPPFSAYQAHPGNRRPV